MKYSKRSFILYMLAMLFWPRIGNLQAQETITASGGNAAGSGGSVSYTIGQVAYTSNTSISGTVTQGVQQPYEILIVTVIEEARGISPEISVYPNPTSDFLKLTVRNYAWEKLRYQLYDIKGALLQNYEIMGTETVIQTGDLLPASYYLKVIDNLKEVKAFIIIKY